MKIRKPHKSGSLYHNYKGFFSMVLIALVDTEYRIRWVDTGAGGSCSAAQIFNHGELRHMIEGGSIGFDETEPYSVSCRGRSFMIANYRISRDRRVVRMSLASCLQVSGS